MTSTSAQLRGDDPSGLRLGRRRGPGGPGGLAVGRDPERRGGALPWPLRRVLEFDERVAPRGLRARRGWPRRSRPRRPGCPGSTARSGSTRSSTRRPGGSRSPGPAGSKSLHPGRVKALPRVEMTTELKCIEGWSEVVDLGRGPAGRPGRRPRAWPPGAAGRPTRRGSPGDLLPYASLATPDAALLRGPGHRLAPSTPRPCSATR